MAHLENHPQAFIDADGVVVNVALFAGHDAELIARCVEIDERGESSVDCCEHGEAQIGWTWDGTQFIAPVIEEPAPAEG